MTYFLQHAVEEAIDRGAGDRTAAALALFWELSPAAQRRELRNLWRLIPRSRRKLARFCAALRAEGPSWPGRCAMSVTLAPIRSILSIADLCELLRISESQFYVLKAQGFFAEHGLLVEIQPSIDRKVRYSGNRSRGGSNQRTKSGC